MKKKYTLEMLEKSAEKSRKKIANKKKKMYHLARSLGFDTMESLLLQGKNETAIKELAEERRLKQLNGGQ